MDAIVGEEISAGIHPWPASIDDVTASDPKTMIRTDVQDIALAAGGVIDGPFKKDLIDIPSEAKKKIIEEVEKEFQFLFDKLNIKDTKDLVSKYISPKAVEHNIEGETEALELTGEGDD